MKKITVIFLLINLFSSQKFNAQVIPCEEIEIGCLLLGRNLRGEHVIRNNTEYQKLLYSTSPHSDCDNYQLPFIDFNKYTLIGYVSSVSGCDFPNISHFIEKINSNYIVNITIIQKGTCKRNNPIILWCLTPLVPVNLTIEINIINTINSH